METPHFRDDLTDIALTDDEAVALAVELGRPWPSPLPTVDVRDERALAAAAMRGWRSLSVRTLSPAVPELAERLAPLAAAGPRLRTYLADPDLARLPDRTCSYFYPLPDGTWVVELTTGAGVHAFRLVAAPAVEQMLSSAVEEAHADGIAPQPAGQDGGIARFLCVSGGPADRARLLVVSRGRLALYQLGDGVTVLPAPRSGADAVRLLHEAGGGRQVGAGATR